MAKYSWEESFGGNEDYDVFASKETHPSSESFVICPAVFYQGLSRKEFQAMQQIYQVAFEKAQAEVNRHSHKKNRLDDFDLGGGI